MKEESVFSETYWAEVVLGLPYWEGTLMRGGLRVRLGGLGRNRRPKIIRPNVRVRCTKCVLTLMTGLASTVVRGAPVPMIVIMKTSLVSQSIGVSCAGMPVNSHGQTLITQALLIMQKTTRWNNAALGGGGTHSSVERTGWSHRSTPGAPLTHDWYPAMGGT